MNKKGEDGALYYDEVLTFERVFDVNQHPRKQSSLEYTNFGFETAGQRHFEWRVPGYPQVYSGMSARVLFAKGNMHQFAGIVGWLNLDTLELAYHKPLKPVFYWLQLLLLLVTGVLAFLLFFVVALVCFKEERYFFAVASLLASVLSLLIPTIAPMAQKNALKIEGILQQWLKERELSRSDESMQ
ncbi:MAG: hypothetical protein ACRCV6_10200 [Formosimonas sp.]